MKWITTIHMTAMRVMRGLSRPLFVLASTHRYAIAFGVFSSTWYSGVPG